MKIFIIILILSSNAVFFLKKRDKSIFYSKLPSAMSGLSFCSTPLKNYLHRQLVFIGPNVIVYIKFFFTTLFTILYLKKSRIFFIFRGMFIYITSYTKKKFIALDIYKMLACAFMAILIAYIIIYYIESHRIELVFLGLTFFSEEICVGVERGINKMYLRHIYLNRIFANPPKPHSFVSLPNNSSLPIISYSRKLIKFFFYNLISYPRTIVFCYPFLLLFTSFFFSHIGINSLPLEYYAFIAFILLIITSLLIRFFFFFVSIIKWSLVHPF